MSYVSAALRRLVIERAGDQCEYCQFPQAVALFTFEMEHIIAEKHDGITEADNLALSCPCCNRFKGSDLGSIQKPSSLPHFFIPVFSNGQITSGKKEGQSFHSLQKVASQLKFCNSTSQSAS